MYTVVEFHKFRGTHSIQLLNSVVSEIRYRPIVFMAGAKKN